MLGLCAACEAEGAPKEVTPSDHYLSAVADVLVWSMAKVQEELCEKHQKRLTQHVATQIEAVARVQDELRGKR